MVTFIFLKRIATSDHSANRVQTTTTKKKQPRIPKTSIFIYLFGKKTIFSKLFIWQKTQFRILYCPLNLIRHYKATKKRFLTHCISGWDKTTFTIKNSRQGNLVYLPCPWIWTREPRHLAAPAEPELVLWRTENKIKNTCFVVVVAAVSLTGTGTLKTL